MLNARRILFLLFCFIFLVSAKASHNRAGEIYYKRIAPFTANVGGVIVQVYTYSITVIKYTDDGSGIADRCQDSVYFGDNTFGMAPRINGGPGGGCSCGNSVGGIIPRCGELIITTPGFRVKLNTYTITHTYSGPGEYLIRSSDPNRNKGVDNISGSENLPFYVEAFLKINSFTGANSSPVFTFPPVDRACTNKCFEHNPGAYDPDGDSLSYEISVPRGTGGQPLLSYTDPPINPGGKFNIDPITGLLSWCNPPRQGEFNMAFLVREWRKNTSGIYEQIGWVLRDMQVIVQVCPDNEPPVINIPIDTCVEAGTLIERNIYISDPDVGDVVTVAADAGAFEAEQPIATISNTVGTISLNSPGFFTKFSWQTTCAHVRQLPYFTTFKAIDDGLPTNLATFRTYKIKVLPPSVKNVTASPIGAGIRVTWDLSTCNPANNPISAYKIYRKNDCTPVVFIPCKTGVVDTSGFVFVGQTNRTTAFFVDDNNGDGLIIGQDYSYIVIALYTDGTQTYGGSQVCTKLTRDVPVIINVDILSTSVDTGRVKINWTRPLKTLGNLDTVAFAGPYQFNLKYKKDDGTNEIIFNSTKNFLYLLDTTFIHTNLNTVANSKEYFIEFMSGTTTVGNSQKATSVFLSAKPSDRRVDLTWEAKTPWSNYNYKVMRKESSATTFTLIGTTSLTAFADTIGLENELTYCYTIESEGKFSDKLFPKPLINHSQETCVKTKDLTPPCTPTISIDADCPNGFVKVNWTDAKQCYRSDDVLNYELFYKATINDEYNKVATVNHSELLSYIHDGLGLISGCYAIKAIDINGNESKLSADFCIDNCPEFELPNIFSPNGDGVNEHFKAIKVRQILEIGLTIFDRWGNLVYKTKDPYFKWDGTSSISKQKVSEGTFFFICDVFEPRLNGTSKRTLKGFFQVVK